MGTHIYTIYIKRAKNIRVLGTGAFCLLVLLSLLSIFPVINHTDSAEAAYTPAASPTLNITSASNITSVDITPTNKNGTFATSTSDVAFGVTTNNLTGYTLTLSSSNGSSSLTNTSYNDSISTIAAVTTRNDFETGNASTYTNKWGLKPSKYNSVANTTNSYYPAPTTGQLVLDTTNSPNPTTPINYTIGLGARVDYEKPSGTYTNTYVIQAVGNQISYTISYQDTTGTGGTTGSDVTDLPGADGSNNIEAAGLTLSSTVPKRTGYTFNKWCDGTVTHVASGNSTCSPNTTTGAPGTTYTAGATYNFSSLSTSSMNNATLYAMWNVNTYSLTANFTANTGVSSVKVCTVSGNCSGTNLKGTISPSGSSVPGLTYGVTYYLYPTFAASGYELYSWAKTSSTGTLSSTTAVNPTFKMGAGNGVVTTTGRLYMQNMASSVCTTTPKTAYDKRDQEAYTIQKLADGKCWMIDNLRLDISDSAVQAKLNSTTTNASNTALNYLKNGGGPSPYATSKVTNFPFKIKTSDDTAGLWDTDDDSNFTKPYIVAGAKNSVVNTTTAVLLGNGSHKFGVYYNYCAVSAGSYCYAKDATTPSSASYDVCPIGWRLPTTNVYGGATGEYGDLYSAYSSDALSTITALSFPYTGYNWNGAVLQVDGAIGVGSTTGHSGHYWSSTKTNNNLMEAMRVGWQSNKYSFAPRNPLYRYTAATVRCLLK